MGKLKIKGYELRDVAVMQAPVSFVNHRGDANPFVNICNREVYPVFVAPMGSVTDQHNYKTWIENKLTPVVPRTVQKSDANPDGLTFEERMEIAKETFVSVSLKEAQNELREYLAKNLVGVNGWYKLDEDGAAKPIVENDNVFYICIDIAHGTLTELYDICKELKKLYGSNIVIMTGNVANPSAYSFYADAGVDFCRVGIGGGCFTPDMEVLTKEGKKKIIDIIVGDEVLTHTGNFRKVTSTHTFNKKERLYRINGIECTGNHLFYVIDKKDKQFVTEDNIQTYAYWVKAEDLDKKIHLLLKNNPIPTQNLI